MKFQALSHVVGQERFYSILMFVRELDIIATKGDFFLVDGKNTITFPAGYEVQWNEVELELENKSYFGSGFITFEPGYGIKVEFNRDDFHNMVDSDQIVVLCRGK